MHALPAHACAREFYQQRYSNLSNSATTEAVRVQRIYSNSRGMAVFFFLAVMKRQTQPMMNFVFDF